jgi:Ribbon-helix-helix protein, copG family
VTTIEIPANLCHRLERVAELTHRPMEELVRQALEAGVPPLPENLPPQMRDDLMTLESLSDDALWQVAQSQLSAGESQRQSELLEMNSSGSISEQDRQALADLRNEADRLMLRKAYALVLLKWRGHRIPPFAAPETNK